MAFRASLSALFGCQLGTASKLLAAAEKGSANEVSEILCSKPQLAAYTGFNNSFSALHRAAAGGHVEVCRSIVEPIKQRIKVAESAVAAGRKKPTVVKKWQALLATVLNQRTSRSMTPLMLACENGHANVAAYLLREGSDPLACDWVHMRTCLHYAAMGGQTDCLRLLCSTNTQVAAKDGFRALRDVVVQDIQVETCRFIDQRAFGGLTALHFAVVTGNLESVQALLRGGASIMVKTDGEAYIGDEYLVPGSTPLHIAVIIGNISIVHAILQAHMENMNVVGQGLDERGRRPWEGSSRTDIRSVRNTFRKLPFHLARERGLQQLMSLVDPRIPIDVALDAARDTEHGIGPKRLSTIVSLVLQQSLLHWLDDCQVEIERERTPLAAHAAAAAALAPFSARGTPDAAAAPAAPALAAAATSRLSPSSVPGSGAQSPRGSGPAGRPPLPPPTLRRTSNGAVQPDVPAALSQNPSCEPASLASTAAPADGGDAEQPAAPVDAAGSSLQSPRTLAAQEAAAAALAAAPTVVTLQPRGSDDMALSPFARMAPGIDPSCPYMSVSAPVSPATAPCSLDITPPNTIISRPPLAASVPSLLHLQAVQEEQAGGVAAGDDAATLRMNSLHGYMGMLSVKRQRTRSLEPPNISAHYPAAARHVRSGSTGAALQPQAVEEPVARRASLQRQQSSPANISSPRESGGSGITAAPGSGAVSPRDRSRGASEQLTGEERTVTVLTVRRSSMQTGTPTIRGMLTSIRDRLRSSEAIPAPPGSLDEVKDKDLSGDMEPPSPAKTDETEGDVECGICLDHVVEVAFSGCEHSLCLDCARNLTKQDKKPPHCPFCRRMVVGFVRVSPTRHLMRAAMA